MEYMLDTDTCIYIIKRKPPQVIERFKQLNMFQVGISSITLSELFYGAAKSSRPDQNNMALMQFLAPLEITAYDDAAASVYGNLRGELERRGTPIGSLDMLIAAHALSRKTILVTNNLREFERIPHLKIETWVG